MAKVTINGEVFSFDPAYKPMAEMLALEKALQTTYGEWENDLAKGSAKAIAGYMWLVWRRNGRDVPFADIESGAVEIDFGQFQVEAEGDEEPDPTTSPATPIASPTTGRSTSGRSRRS